MGGDILAIWSISIPIENFSLSFKQNWIHLTELFFDTTLGILFHVLLYSQ